MVTPKYLIYYYGPRNPMFQRLSTHFANSYDVLGKEDIMLFEVIENKLLLAILVDMNLVDTKISQQVLDKNPAVPVIGLSDNYLIQPAFNYLTDIATLTDDPMTRFDMLEKKLMNYKKSRFGGQQNDKFRNYIINQHIQEPDFLKSIQSMYQPIYNLQNTQFDRFEVLMRWPTAPFKDFKINELFAAVEDDALIDAITLAQIKDIAAFLAELHQQTGKYYNTFINLSSSQFNNPLLINEIQQTLKFYQIPPEVLYFEIHPSEFDSTAGIWKENLHDINKMSANVSIKYAKNSDFSISDLELYDVQSMKLQGDLILSAHEPDTAQLLEQARKLNIQLIAEQVETAQHFDFIQKNPIQFAQGYFFYKPLEAQKLLQVIKKGS